MTASLASLRTRFRSWKKDCGFFIRWRAAALAAVRRRVAEPPRDVLIYPSDPAQIVGAIGDDAMITAVVGHFTGLDPEARFTVLCRDGAAAEIVRGAGHTPLQLPEGKNFAREMLGIFRAKPFDALVVIGADVMDGYYSAYLSKELLIAADLAARSGMRSIILGFSFNDAPPAELRKYFAGIDRAVELNVRDPISLERLRRFAPVRAIPVADSAFLISPASVDEETRRWIAAAKASGKTVLGLNLHPMLFTSDPAAALERLIAETAKALERVSGEHDAAWLLVPHDYRAPPYGDEAFLRALQAAVGERDGLMVRYFEGHHRATTLKGLAGLLDGVITGRMHLAIAALGMGTPVMCFAYQGKFAGLFRHFGLSETWLVEVGIFDRDAAFAEAVLGFFRNLAELRDTVRAQLPGVERMAALNFVRVNP
jgi:polysaccharide pyruvyl transferase WcaK-like protein